MSDGLGGGEGTVATRPERRPRDQDRMGRHDAALTFPSGLVRKRVIGHSVRQSTTTYLVTPVSPFHAEPLTLPLNAEPFSAHAPTDSAGEPDFRDPGRAIHDDSVG